jgi:hypothetical protein
MAKPLQVVTESITDLATHVASTKRREGMAIWEPPDSVEVKASPIEIPIERDIINVILTPALPGEGRGASYDRKEREISTLFDRLTPAQSLAVSRRLTNLIADDPLSAAFGRLVVERRVRLLAGLSRRRAIAATRARCP